MSHPYLDYFQKDTLPILSVNTREYVDNKLDEVASLWSAGELDDIIQTVKKSLDLNIYDIRLVTFYLYSLWSKSECSLYQILESLYRLLGQPSSVWLYEDSAAIKAEEKSDKTPHSINDKQLYNYLQLLLKRVEQRLSRYFDQQYANEQDTCETVKYLVLLAELINEKYEFEDIITLINQISAYYEDVCEKEKYEQAQLKEQEEITRSETSVEQPEQRETKVRQNNDIYETSLFSNHAANHSHSPVLLQLLNKLQIFEALMQEKAFYKAAIVFENIQTELDQFNPLQYFPEYFSNYAKTRALFATELSQLIQQHQSPQSEALKDYFSIDPNGFMQLDIEQHSTTNTGVTDSQTAFEEEGHYAYDE